MESFDIRPESKISLRSTVPFTVQESDRFDAFRSSAYYSRKHYSIGGSITVALAVLTVWSMFREPSFEDEEKYEELPANFSFECGISYILTKYPPTISCPEECPIWQEDVRTEYECDFQCVQASACGKVQKGHTVADKKRKFCRTCIVPYCVDCEDGPEERCAKCQWDAYLSPSDGQCHSRFTWIWKVVFGIIGVLIVFILAWYVHLWFRPVVNDEGLAEGLTARSQAKLHTPKNDFMGVSSGQEKSRRTLWPLDVNLLKMPVAGPGLMLHMEFQVVIMIWASILMLVWLLIGHFLDPDNLHAGSAIDVETPMEMCRSVEWGAIVRRRNRFTKMLFLGFAYVFTFVLSVMHAFMQRVRFQRHDNKHITMSDYAAFFTGLPSLPGADPVETELQACIQSATGQDVVGVSICWDFLAKKEDVLQAVNWVLEEAEHREIPEEKEESVKSWRMFRYLDRLFLPPQSFGMQEQLDGDDIDKLVRRFSTGHSGFVVFNSEEARDAAVRSCHGISFKGGTLELQPSASEPDTINWEFMLVRYRTHVIRVCSGVAMMLIALGIWIVCFYLPYASWQASFSYGIGEEPGYLSDTLFSLLITTGNFVMLFVTDAISKRVGFGIDDIREAAHMLMYTTCVLLNAFLDIYCVYWVAYKSQVELGAHSHDNKLLKDLPYFPDAFRTYALQKAIGGRVFALCFPSCFLLPFIAEQLFFLMVPAHLSMLIVGSYDNIRGARAEWALSMFATMDMSRYADIILNVCLSVAIFLFPTGYWAMTFIALLVCHAYIFALDTWKVLRCVPTFDYGGNYIDRCANHLMIVPCSMLAFVLVFSAMNCEPYYLCVRGWALFATCVVAVALHAVTHFSILHWIIPRLARIQHVREKVPYSAAARMTPSTYFATNPVHCLRSCHYYNHRPPCRPYIPGKEHLLRAHEKIGIHFEDEGVEVENYLVRHKARVGTFVSVKAHLETSEEKTGIELTELSSPVKTGAFDPFASSSPFDPFAGASDGPPAFSHDDT